MAGSSGRTRPTGFALPPPTEPSLYEASKIGSCVDSIIGDLRNLEAVTEAVACCRPDIVFHMAAQPLVRRSYRDPVETYATNVMGTVHLLEAVRRFEETRVIVHFQRQVLRESRDAVGISRNGPMGGFDPYSSSKGCAELVAAAYRRSYFESGPTRLVRAGNVIGGGDWAEPVDPRLHAGAKQPRDHHCSAAAFGATLAARFGASRRVFYPMLKVFTKARTYRPR